MGEIKICAMCGEEFEVANSEAEAMQEFADKFGPVVAMAEKDPLVVCDSCYKKIDPAKFPEMVEATKQYYLDQKKN